MPGLGVLDFNNSTTASDATLLDASFVATSDLLTEDDKEDVDDELKFRLDEGIADDNNLTIDGFVWDEDTDITSDTTTDCLG